VSIIKTMTTLLPCKILERSVIADNGTSAYFRGQYSSVAKERNAVPGAMLATGWGEQSAAEGIKAANLGDDKGRVTIACINSPSSTTLSGDAPAIDYMNDMLTRAGVFARKLKVETAYHSHHMNTVAEAYSTSLADLKPSELHADVEFVSSVTGEKKTSGFGAEYWRENLVSSVSLP
jgi:acyl transferase domain-containing protein